MAASGTSASRTLVELVDSAMGALERKDYIAASQKYARASEQLFGEVRNSNEPARKVELTRLAQRLLRNAFLFRGETPPEELQESDQNRGAGGNGATRNYGCSFDDVAGLEEVKETLRMRVIYPLKHPEKMAQYGLRVGGGVLLYGPPGTGKTMIARAVAGELELPFFVLKASEILGQYVGESEKNLAALFEEARAYGNGAVLFVDEIDALAASRDSGIHEASRRLLNQLLQELDGVDKQNDGLLFLAATNEPWLLDSALLRPGRFDEKCYIPLPDEAARLELLKLHVRDCPLDADVRLERLAAMTDGYSGADLMCVCERAKQIPFREAIINGTDRRLNLTDLESSLAQVKPSVRQNDIVRFQEYANA